MRRGRCSLALAASIRSSLRSQQMDATAKIGRNPMNKHHIQPEYGDEQANAGRDSRASLARPHSQAPTEIEKKYFSTFS